MPETPPDVGTLIARARHRKRLTQQELAEQLQVHVTTVANWEIGKHFPHRYAGLLEELLEITIPAPEAVTQA